MFNEHENINLKLILCTVLPLILNSFTLIGDYHKNASVYLHKHWRLCQMYLRLPFLVCLQPLPRIVCWVLPPSRTVTHHHS